MVIVGGDSALVAQTTKLRVRARGGANREALGMADASDMQMDRSYGGDMLRWPDPLRIALVPQGDDASRVYEVTIEALHGETVLSTAIVTGGYVSGETRALPVTLGLCSPTCGPGQSCELARDDALATCSQAQFRDAAKLAAYDPEKLPDVIFDGEMDAGMESGVIEEEGGVIEAGPPLPDAMPDVFVPPDDPFELSATVDTSNPARVLVTGAVQSGWTVTIDWGDGMQVVVDEGAVDESHEFSTAGTHHVAFSGSGSGGEKLEDGKTLVLRFVPEPDVDADEIYVPFTMASEDCSNDLSNFGADVFKDRFADSSQACFINDDDAVAPSFPSVAMGPNVTIMGWIRISSGALPNAVVIGRGSLPAIISETNAGLGFAVRANGSIVRRVRPAPAANTWHFYAGVLETTDGSNTALRFYLDAVSDSTSISGWTNETDACALRVGGGVTAQEDDGNCAAYGADAFQTGSYDDVRVYDRALSAEEIRIIYELERP